VSKGYIYRKRDEATQVPCPCGTSTRIIQIGDTPVANLHVTHITDSVKHYHKHCTEYYYILEGRGKMELNDDVVELEPGVTIVIEPGTAHRAYGDITTIVFGVPAWEHTDEFFLTDEQPAAQLAGSAQKG
jgi:mannose-6-phosphate isomerase-like protein (cupin superfamily)